MLPTSATLCDLAHVTLRAGLYAFGRFKFGQSRDHMAPHCLAIAKRNDQFLIYQ
jgi:hypothetical protein